MEHATFYYFKFFSTHVKANKRKQVKLIFMIYLVSPNISETVPFQLVINIKMIEKFYFFFFFDNVFELWWAFYTNSPSQFGYTTFQVLRNPV